jgi:polysaccharide deacetylase 2 family uncharacterized protein YibQ
MTADDLNAPLGQGEVKRRFKFPAAWPQVAVAALGLFFAAFLLWALINDDPFGGEPMMAVSIDPHAAAAPKKSDVAANPAAPAPQDSAPLRTTETPATAAVPQKQTTPANSKTVTIINGETGARQEMVVPGEANGAVPRDITPADQKFVEMTPRGPIPKIAADGTRPAEAFARPVKPIPGKPDAPRIALIVGGLGVSAGLTADAIGKLPGAVTLAFMPYGADVDQLVSRARGAGHEVLLQAPMEPFGYPDNDSGPQTLLTSLTPEQNIERLYWLMSRFQGYVGIAGAMGARFTASEQSFGPILHEIARRGLIFVDDGSNPRSVAGRVAGAGNLLFAKTDAVLDSVPTPVEIDHALGRMEMAAREHGAVVGMASALPVSIERIARWAKGAESRGIQLVPISAIALKPKQS